MTRLFIYSITALVIAYDLCCMAFGWTTVSTQIRTSDAELGGLIRWAILALWCHWFLPVWTTNNGL
jgi:hypothetical protein